MNETESYPGHDAFERDIANYMDRREAGRRAHAAAVLGALTDRERRLVQEAAIMGFVQGQFHGTDRTPSNEVIMLHVITGCHSNNDLYPLLGAEPNTMG